MTSLRAQLDLPDDLLDEIVARVAERVLARLEPEQEWMTASECADWLRWPVKRIQNLTAAGRIPHVREGHRVLYNRERVRSWLLEQETRP